MTKPQDVYLPRNITCVLCFREVDIFSVWSHPWKPYVRFSVITFIVIIGCFSFCIQTRWMAQKKVPKKRCPQGSLHFIYFSYAALIALRRDKKALKSVQCWVFFKISYCWREKKPWKWGWESPLSIVWISDSVNIALLFINSNSTWLCTLRARREKCVNNS